MVIGDKVVINRKDLIKAVGKINDIVDNANSSVLYGVISYDREYYCKEEELEIIK
ncbi:MAG: hypothetical protein HDQ99_02625 [Lachnospiraceae bacterium]|nr:hypothetical protein [Lachnospiraceae bacterium]